MLQDGLDKIAEETRQRVVNNEEREVTPSEVTEPRRVEVERTHQPASRAKTIAEKLGFFSYDEEELDTPTYMRVDRSTSSNRESNLN